VHMLHFESAKEAGRIETSIHKLLNRYHCTFGEIYGKLYLGARHATVQLYDTTRN